MVTATEVADPFIQFPDRLITGEGEVAEAHGGLAVDLGTILVRKAAVLAKLWDGHTIYHDGTHFNPVGNEIVAGVVLRALGLMVTPGDPDWPD